MNDLQLHRKCEVTSTALQLTKDVTETEWLEIGKKLSMMEGSVNWWIGGWINFGVKKGYVPRERYQLAIDETNLKRGILWHAAYVDRKVNSLIRIKELTWSHHRLVADLEPEQQTYWLGQAQENKWSIRDMKRAMRKDRILVLPSEKYCVIYADPPWEYETMQHGKEEQETTLETHYPTMNIDELCAMDVESITEDEAVLFLWATSPKIFEAKEVMEAWGFQYKAQMIWDKVKHNVGNYFSVRHEILLVGTKGSYLPDNPKLYDSVQTIERSDRHSEKPEEIRNIIDDLYPIGKRIELFARKKMKGWDTWGNEVE